MAPLPAHVRAAAGDRHDVAVDLRDRVIDLVHVRLHDLDEHLVAVVEGDRLVADLVERALHHDLEVVERQALRAGEQEVLARLDLHEVQHARAVAGELARHARVHLHEERLGLAGRAGAELAQPALELDRDRLLRQDDAVAVAGRARPSHDLAHALRDVLARHLDQAELGDLGGERLRAVLVERLAQRLEHRLAVARPRHVDEVDDDDAADVAQAQLVDDRLGRLEVRARDRVLQARLLAAPDERAGVDVDDGQRLGVVDHQVAAARQVHPARDEAADDLLDAVGLEQRLGLLVELDAVDELGRRAAEERDKAVGLLLVVDDRALEMLGEDVAHDADREIGLLEDERRRGRGLDALLEDLVQLEEVLQLALEVLALGARRGRADDRAAAVQVETAGGAAQALALLVVEALGDADPLARRRVDHVAPGDGELHREPGALRLQRVLDDLYHDLLARLQQVGDLLAALLAPAAPGRLDAGQDDLVDVQEPVLVEADVDEGRLEPGQDVVDLALVDVAHDGAVAAALEVERRAPVPGGGVRRAAPAPTSRRLGGRGTGRLKQRDPGLPAVHADDHLLLHVLSRSPREPGRGPSAMQPRALARRSTAAGQRPGKWSRPRIPRS